MKSPESLNNYMKGPSQEDAPTAPMSAADAETVKVEALNPSEMPTQLVSGEAAEHAAGKNEMIRDDGKDRRAFHQIGRARRDRAEKAVSQFASDTKDYMKGVGRRAVDGAVTGAKIAGAVAVGGAALAAEGVRRGAQAGVDAARATGRAAGAAYEAGKGALAAGAEKAGQLATAGVEKGKTGLKAVDTAATNAYYDLWAAPEMIAEGAAWMKATAKETVAAAREKGKSAYEAVMTWGSTKLEQISTKVTEAHEKFNGKVDATIEAVNQKKEAAIDSIGQKYEQAQEKISAWQKASQLARRTVELFVMKYAQEKVNAGVSKREALIARLQGAPEGEIPTVQLASN